RKQLVLHEPPYGASELLVVLGERRDGMALGGGAGPGLLSQVHVSTTVPADANMPSAMSENASKVASGAAPAGEAPGRAGSKPAGARLLVAMALASGITSVPNSAIVLPLPTIHRQFDASLTSLEWTVTGYLLAYSALMIAAGRLADV